MYKIEQINNHTVEFRVDTSLFSDSVISKILYWLSDRYIVYRESLPDPHKQRIVLTLHDSTTVIQPTDFDRLKQKLSQDFTDFHTREIIQQETIDIRNILFVKAFANRDDFVEFHFSDNH